MTKITGSMVVLVSKCARFDPSNPAATEVSQFTFVDASGALDESGKLTGFWAEEGYIYAGHAAIEVSLLPQADITARAVETLKQQKMQVLADAHAKATHIEGQIQSLLAIAN